MRDDLAALVAQHIRTFQSLERGFGILVAERGGFLVIGLGGVLVLRATTAGLRKRAHPLERRGMSLRRRLLEQAARRDVIFWTADAVGHHGAELVLRFGIGLGSLGEERAGTRRIRRCSGGS